MNVHYVAQIKVERIEKTGGTTDRYNTTTPAERAVSTLATVVIKGSDLDSLVQKAGAHLALVEDVPGADDRG